MKLDDRHEEMTFNYFYGIIKEMQCCQPIITAGISGGNVIIAVRLSSLLRCIVGSVVVVKLEAMHQLIMIIRDSF